jgi:flagellar assembly factor FliW
VNSAATRGMQESILAMLLQGQQAEFCFPEGLLGFPSYRRFVLSRYQPPDGSESPFLLLQTKETEADAGDSHISVSFPLISPYWLVPDYHVAPPPEVLAKLDVGAAAECVILVIVTLRERLEEITVNLQGPLLFNPLARLGCQLVVEEYPVRYPLLGSEKRT